MSSVDSIRINTICWYVLPVNEIFYIIPKECLLGKSGRHIESCRCWKSTTLRGADIICCICLHSTLVILILGFAEKIPIHYRSGPGKKPAIPAAANVHDLGLGHDPVGGGDDDDGAQSRESRSAQLKVQKTATFLPGQCISTAWKPFQEKAPPVFVPFGIGSSAWRCLFTHLPHTVAGGKGMDFLHMIHLYLAEKFGCHALARLQQPQEHSYLCGQYFRVSRQWCGCQCLGFLTCAQMLRCVVAHRGCTDTVRESVLKVESGAKIPSLYTGVEPMSVLCLVFQSVYCATLPPPPPPHQTSAKWDWVQVCVGWN